MTNIFNNNDRPDDPYTDSSQTNVGNHPIDQLMDAQHAELFPNWEEWWMNNSPGPDDRNGPSTNKRGAFIHDDDPIFMMTKSEPKKGYNRSWGNLRRDALAAPNGFEEGHHTQEPLINWAYSHHTPESWNVLKDHMLSENEEADRMVINLSLKGSKGFKSFNNKVLKGDDETVAINPPEVIRTFSDKHKTFEHLDEQGLPAIPSTHAETLFLDGEEELTNQIGYPEEGYILKPFNGSGGSGIVEVDSIDEVNYLLNTEHGIRELFSEKYSGDRLDSKVEEYSENPESLWSSYMLQTKIPHDSDLRVISFGDTIANAERRIAPDGDVRTNLSQVSDEYMGEEITIYGEVLNALDEERIEPIYLNLLDKPHRESELGTGITRLVEDIVESFDSEEYSFPSGLPQPPIKTGIDALEAERSEVDHLPSEWLDRAENYADGDTLYFVPELNGNPGSGADVLAMYNSAPEQLTPIHAYNLMRDQAGLETYDLNTIVNNYNDDMAEGQIFQRMASYYPSFEQDVEDFMSHAQKNVRPGDR